MDEIPPPTIVHQLCREIGESAMETMLERLSIPSCSQETLSSRARGDAVVGRVSDEEAESLILKYEWLRRILVDIVWSECWSLPWVPPRRNLQKW